MRGERKVGREGRGRVGCLASLSNS